MLVRQRKERCLFFSFKKCCGVCHTLVVAENFLIVIIEMLNDETGDLSVQPPITVTQKKKKSEDKWGLVVFFFITQKVSKN